VSRGRHSGPLSGGTIRRRLSRILALPAAVVLLLLAVVAAGQWRDYSTARSTARAVDLTLAVQDLVNTLQTERGVTSAVLGGNESFRPELATARRAVDEQRGRVGALAGAGGAADARVRTTLSQLDGLAAVRAATDSTAAGRAATFAFFTERITALRTVDVGLGEATDPELRRGVGALQALQDLTEATAQERAFLNGVFSAGGFGKGEFVQFAAMRADRQSALQRLRGLATADQRIALDFSLGTGAARTTQYFEQVALDAADGRPLVVNPQAWWSGLTTVLADLGQLQKHLGSRIQIRAFDLETAAAQRLGLLGAGVLATLIGSIYLAVLASRSITRPLATLAHEAETVAAERLPAAVQQVQAGHGDEAPQPPVPVQVPPRASQEIQSVATALDRLQTAAYDLAIEQALQRRRTVESLVNLGRRNQSLIRRQLGFITSLEREEIDPQALANLFELDHLATRMRRNADSLLVLVGSASPRRWSTPVAMSDVIRAAVSEVEEYRRVVLRRVDEAMVAGPAVGAVAHVLSELIENGLTFSPPDCEVEIQGRHQPDGYLIAITDQGVGMTTEELQQANSRLRGEGDFIAAPTRFLGHFVVGELARQLGSRVELLPSPVVGVTARVTLPSALLVAAPSLPAGAAPRASAPAIPEPDDEDTGEIEAVDAQIVPMPARDGEEVVVHVDVEDVELVPASVPARAADTAAEFVASQPCPSPLPTASIFERLPRSDGQPLPPAATIRLRPGEALRPHDATDRPSAPATAPAGARSTAADTTAADTTADDTTADDEPTRTRNGLVKRRPRPSRPGDDASPQPGFGQRVIDLSSVEAERPPEAARAAAVDSTPSTVGARLTALRAGVRRGQQAQLAEQPAEQIQERE